LSKGKILFYSINRFSTF